jgi:hypothetical protein
MSFLARVCNPTIRLMQAFHHEAIRLEFPGSANKLRIELITLSVA